METILTDYIEQQLRAQGDDLSLDADDDLIEAGFDSIGYLRLVVFIDKTFGVKVPDSDVTIENFGSVANVVGYLSARGVGADANQGRPS